MLKQGSVNTMCTVIESEPQLFFGSQNQILCMTPDRYSSQYRTLLSVRYYRILDGNLVRNAICYKLLNIYHVINKTLYKQK